MVCQCHDVSLCWHLDVLAMLLSYYCHHLWSQAVTAVSCIVADRIPYYLSFSRQYPGKFLLSYLPRKSPRHELVTVTPEGIRYRSRTFPTLASMVRWFKEHFRDPIPGQSPRCISSTGCSTFSVWTLLICDLHPWPVIVDPVTFASDLEHCNPWPPVAICHISISQLFSLWCPSHYDVIRYWAGHAQHDGCMYVRTPYRI